jgi:hypothetical protein
MKNDTTLLQKLQFVAASVLLPSDVEHHAQAINEMFEDVFDLQVSRYIAGEHLVPASGKVYDEKGIEIPSLVYDYSSTPYTTATQILFKYKHDTDNSNGN